VIVHFEIKPEFRQRYAKLLRAPVEDLAGFFDDLESEIAWHLALGGMRESTLGEAEILTRIRRVYETGLAFHRELEALPEDAFGWLIEFAPRGIDYKLPFRAVLKPTRIVVSMTGKAVESIKPSSGERHAKSTSVDFIRKIAGVCDKNFGARPDMASQMFQEIVQIIFDSLGIGELRDVKELCLQAMGPRHSDNPLHRDEPVDHERTVIRPPGYTSAYRKE